jgi:predicted MPP superfamily phosphohydrolase
VEKKIKLTKKILTDLFALPEIQNDNDAAAYLQREHGIEVARRTLTDARHRYDIPAKSKRDAVELNLADAGELDFDEVWEAILKMQKALTHIRQDKTEATVTINNREPYAIAFMGDVHMGDLGTDYEQLRTDIKLIKETENFGLITGGDYINNFMKRNKNYNEYEVVQPRVQWKLAEWFFGELEDSLLAVACGNHDMWSEELTQIDSLYSILKHINTLYTKHGANMNLVMPGFTYTIKFKHNFRAGSSLNPTHGVKQMVRMDTDADVAALFDTHVGAIEEYFYKDKWRVAIRTGTYKVDDHWAHAMGFEGNAHPCVPVVVFHPDKRYFQVARSLQQGVDMLEWARDAYARGTFGEASQYNL